MSATCEGLKTAVPRDTSAAPRICVHPAPSAVVLAAIAVVAGRSAELDAVNSALHSGGSEVDRQAGKQNL